ncbi:MAG: NupC/NupG family nucleoside CNT transporter [Bythopirellula sp.]|nr:NupC/NupG family nucleoside CNT transporter [Bythopirellula sp.]
MQNLTSLFGIVAILALAWAMSSHKDKFPWKTVVCGLLLQLVFAVVFLKTSQGKWLFDQVDNIFVSLLDCVGAGTSFVFGENYADHFFAFKVLPTIIFFSAFMSIFYYYGVMQKVVGVMAVLMQKILGTSGAETLSAAANVFVGQTEAPLVIRPYINSMTMSELNAVMIGGFATMAGGVLAALASMGFDAGNLLSASVINAPGGLLLAKVVLPELGEPKTRGSVKIDIEDESANVLESIAVGAIGGLQLALNVGAMLIVFLALIAVVNGLLGWVGGFFGYPVVDGVGGWSLEAALGYLFYPVAWLIGIESQDCAAAGQLMGLKMATNEFVAYGRLAEWDAADSAIQINDRSREIMMFALCGFANFSSIGIQLGGIGGMAPERRGDLARLGLRAMLVGTLASFLTACFAGLLL